MENFKYRPYGTGVKKPTYNSNKLNGSLKEEVNEKQLIDNIGNFQDAFVQNLICANRDQYMTIELDSDNYNYALEFIPNNVSRRNTSYEYNGGKALPYAFNVNLVDRLNSKRIFLVEMHCYSNRSIILFDMLNDDNNHKKTAKINTTYRFEEKFEVISEEYFTLSDDDKTYLKEVFPEKLMIISIINFYLTNAMVEQYKEKYQLTPYAFFDFVNLSSFDDTKIEMEYRQIINPLLNRPIANEYYFVDPLAEENNHRLYDSMRRMLYNLPTHTSRPSFGEATSGIEPISARAILPGLNNNFDHIDHISLMKFYKDDLIKSYFDEKNDNNNAEDQDE